MSIDFSLGSMKAQENDYDNCVGDFRWSNGLSDCLGPPKHGTFRVISTLEGRSPGTAARAKEAGMQDSSIASIAKESRIILSVLPPSESIALARKVVEAAPTTAEVKPIYCDLNAVSPETAHTVAEIVKNHFRFVDGCIIGGPPSSSYNPTIYLSGNVQDALEEVLSLLGHDILLLKLRALKGGDGAASALKLSYAGMTKGFTALAATMILSAAKQSPETADALLNELSASQPAFLKYISRTLPGAVPKAYRFVGEMEEIAAYVESLLGGTSTTYTGIAEVYQRIDDDLKTEGKEVEILRQFGNLAQSKVEENV
ncbi:MAG: hypothetical protein CYPHOPRED_004395 [Cyphobasidiales sp. Tagirdzhanova-0007]|nr:MAG: hypothetical protein CYPHOPRED_004395 [Cyphobasidiales sp. Tagirdzhanova-0007]